MNVQKRVTGGTSASGRGVEPSPRPRERRAQPDEPTLAFRYLYLFRRLVVSAAVVGAVLSWANEWPALAAALVCIGIGELLESSYYLSVLRWRQRHHPDPGWNGLAGCTL